LRDAKAGILLNEHIAEDGATVFAHACRLGAEGIVSKRIDSTYQPGTASIPNLTALALHGDAGRIAGLDPDAAGARDNRASRLTAAVMICSGKS
jgi:hypothetical protein